MPSSCPGLTFAVLRLEHNATSPGANQVACILPCVDACLRCDVRHSDAPRRCQAQSRAPQPSPRPPQLVVQKPEGCDSAFPFAPAIHFWYCLASISICSHCPCPVLPDSYLHMLLLRVSNTA
eukprot:1778540-Rhodomonas_salina.3